MSGRLLRRTKWRTVNLYIVKIHVCLTIKVWRRGELYHETVLIRRNLLIPHVAVTAVHALTAVYCYHAATAILLRTRVIDLD